MSEIQGRDWEVVRFFIKYFLDEKNIRFRTITKRQETFLLARIKSGDKKALADLAQVYDWFAQESAVIYHDFYKKTDLEILLQTARIEIKKAATKYNPGRGYPFAIYAMWGILRGFKINISDEKISQFLRKDKN